jgi:hypothetical protein
MNKLFLLLPITLLTPVTVKDCVPGFKNEISEDYIGNNMLDYDHLLFDSTTGTFSYDVWIKSHSGEKHIFVDSLLASKDVHELIIVAVRDYQAVDLNNFDPNDHYYVHDDNYEAIKDDINVEAFKIDPIKTAVCHWNFDPDDYYDELQYDYFTIYSMTDSNFIGKTKEFFRNKIYMIYGYSYMKYTDPYYDDNRRSYNNAKGSQMYYLTTVDHLVDVKDITNQIGVNKGATLTLVEDNYTANYKKEGVYTLNYLVKENEYESNFTLYIKNFVKDVPSIISKDDKKEFIYKLSDLNLLYRIPEIGSYKENHDIHNLSNFDMIIPEIYENFSFSFGKTPYTLKLVMLSQVDLDNDGIIDKDPYFASYYNKPGVYDFEWQMYGSTGGSSIGLVASYKFSIKIIDNYVPNVYLPKHYVFDFQLQNYNNQDLCKRLEEFLANEHIEAKNVSIVYNPAENDSNAIGEYEVIYKYDLDGVTNFATLTLKIEDEKTDHTCVIVSITISAILVLSIATYFTIRSVKNRKKDN